MFIDFAGITINTDYIVSVYKTEVSNKLYDVNIKIFGNNSAIKELYDTKEERDKRFNDILSIFYKMCN